MVCLDSLSKQYAILPNGLNAATNQNRIVDLSDQLATSQVKDAKLSVMQEN
jgi:hypothetical protein